MCVHQSELHFTTDQECAACNRYRFFFFFCDAAMPWLRGGEGKHRRFCIHANFILSANPSPSSSFRQRLSLLHSAIKLPAKAVVAAFLEAGIPVNSVDTLEVCMPL